MRTSVRLEGKSAVEPEKANTPIICSKFSLRRFSLFPRWHFHCGRVLIRAHYVPAERSAVCHRDIPPGDLDKQAKTNSTQ